MCEERGMRVKYAKQYKRDKKRNKGKFDRNK